MSSCCATNGTNQFFNTQARKSEKYFRKKGLRPEQKYLREGIQRSGLLQHASILEIGCGVGGLHLRLLQDGADSAAGFDISENMIRTAQQLSTDMGLNTRTQYWQGDFVALCDQASTADVAILDKVICCYDDFEELVARSAAKTKRLYAVSYPRPSFLARFVFHAGIAVFKLLRNSFHPYYHSPHQVQAAIEQQGFEKTFERHTILWVVQLFQRRDR